MRSVEIVVYREENGDFTFVEPFEDVTLDLDEALFTSASYPTLEAVLRALAATYRSY